MGTEVYVTCGSGPDRGTEMPHVQDERGYASDMTGLRNV